MKKFLCKWGEGYYREGEKVLPLEELNEENGWDEYFIQKLNNAHVGEVVDCSDYSGILIVQRVE